MPKLKNVVTGVVKELPARYVGLYPYILVEDVIVEGYKPAAVDGDNDGKVQDGTAFERPVDTELTEAEQVAAVKKATKKSK